MLRSATLSLAFQTLLQRLPCVCENEKQKDTGVVKALLLHVITVVLWIQITSSLKKKKNS